MERPDIEIAPRQFLGIKLTPLTKSDLLAKIEQALAKSRPLAISYLNPNYVVAAHRDKTLLEAMNSFDIMLADGISVVWGAYLLGCPVPERAGTDDVGLELFGLCRELGLGAFLLGAAPGVANKAAENLLSRLPGVEILGTHHGWFKPHDDSKVVETINASGADFLLVCLGTPRQQLWVAKVRSNLKARVVMTGGGYLDHLAERVDWYPKWVDFLKLNWLYRLWRDPRRLWRRYTVEMVQFGWLVLCGAYKANYSKKREQTQAPSNLV